MNKKEYQKIKSLTIDIILALGAQNYGIANTKANELNKLLVAIDDTYELSSAQNKGGEE